MLRPSHNTVSYLFICISMLKKETLYPSHNAVIYLFVCPFPSSQCFGTNMIYKDVFIIEIYSS